MGISLFEHNQTAYEMAEAMLADTGKAAIIHPTGTGKSFIGFKLCEQHPDKRICWFSPSSYIFDTQLEALKDAAEGYEPKNIKFYTYSKLVLLTEKEISELRPNFIILDEFHRCGAPTWGEAVNKILKTYPETPFLGLSATNVRYLDSQRDMALELFDGNIASEMTLGEAMVRGILTPPKYVLSVFSYQKDLERYQHKIKRAKSREVRVKAEEYLEALRRALENADGLDEIFDKHIPDRHGKYIVFCSSREHMQEMKSMVPEWFAKVDEDPQIYSVYSDDPMAEKEFQEFKNNKDPHHLKLLFCIDALNEGVHVKGINGVILLRPTLSPTIYKQQIGRAMAAKASHDVVIFDIVMNIDNLYSISSLQHEMDNAIAQYICTGDGRLVVTDKFNIIDEVHDCRILFDRLNDVLSASWEMMYQHAKAYFQEHGNLDVKKKYKTDEGYSLGSWLHVQRQVYAGHVSGILTKKQIDRLNDLGMRWTNSSDQSWEKYFAAAKSYYEKHGNLACKSTYVTEDGISLGDWLTNIRSSTLTERYDKQKFLTPERVELLNSIGMIWNKRQYLWDEKLAEARKYFNEHHDLNVPTNYICDNGINLGGWISDLREMYEKKDHGTLTEEKIAQLEAIGMTWQSRYDLGWFSFYKEAQTYFEENKSLDLPHTYVSPTGASLGPWVFRQRKHFAAGKLDKEKVALLNEIGMVWEILTPWQKRYQLAKQYFQENGNIDIPLTLVVDGAWIGRWVYDQRRKKDKLNAEQIELLEKIGMSW